VLAVRNTSRGIVVEEVEPPTGEGVRVRVRAAGICGSDLEMASLGTTGVTFGHEFAGLTDDGTAVAVQPVVPCGMCDRCTAGESQQCDQAMATGYGFARDGGMAGEVRVDESCLAPLPAELELADASLVEPTAVALHALHRGGVVAGMRVHVVGAGSIGLLSAAVARHLGAEVTIAARHDAQRGAAERLGVDVGAGRRCDVVVEAAGSSSAFEEACGRASRGGTVVLVSTTWRPVTVSFLRAQMREVTIVPAFLYGHAHGEREFDRAAAIVAAHPEIPAALVTHRFPLADAAEAFRVAADRAAGAIKVVLEP
jgi:threonine dehydrogenase-like Zn-dependent dehydrogenase